MGGWHAPKTTAYTNEDELQNLVADTPTLLPGVGDGPIAVAREVPLGSAGYVDILIVEGSGEITLVECKLRANPEIRRQVVGQALAYAAALWQSTYDELDDAFASRASRPLASLLGEGETDWDQESFRETVARNLSEGSLRLVIAVDQITDELKRTVTFLNRHTTSALRLLALELRRAADDGVEVLILESYGEESASEKPRRGRGDEAGMIAAIREQHPGPVGERMIALYEFVRDRGARLSWAASGVAAFLGEDEGNPVAVGVGPGSVGFDFAWVRDRRTPAEMARLAELVRTIPGAVPYYEALEHRDFRMRPLLKPEEVLGGDEALEAFKTVLDQAIKLEAP
jgi:hypothetical protein